MSTSKNYDTRMKTSLPYLLERTSHPSVTRVENMILLCGYLAVRLNLLTRWQYTYIYFIMHLRKEGDNRIGEPSLATELKPAQVATPIRTAKNSVRVLFKLFIWQCFETGYLHEVSQRVLAHRQGKEILPGRLRRL